MYHQVSVQVLELSARWLIFRQLFGTSDERLKLLESCGPDLFSIIQEALLDDMSMILSRLTDPPEQGRKGSAFQNLVLERLIRETGATETSGEGKKLYAQLSRVKKECAVFRNHRDKRIAHTDLQTALNPKLHLLPARTRKALDSSVKGVISLMNRVEKNLGFETVDYADMNLRGDGETLIRLLERARDHRACLHSKA